MNQPDFNKIANATTQKIYKRVYDKYFLPHGESAEGIIKQLDIVNSSKNVYLNALNWILNELGIDSKAKIVRSSREPKGRPIDTQTWKLIMEKYPDITDEYWLYTFLKETGLRADAIKIENLINTKGRELRVIDKGDKERTIFMPKGWTFKNVENMCKAFPTYNSIYNAVKKLESFGEWITPHSLRYTYATNLYNSGVELPVISDLLGHSSLDQTWSYIKTDKSNYEIANDMQYLTPSERFDIKLIKAERDRFKKLFFEAKAEMERREKDERVK